MSRSKKPKLPKMHEIDMNFGTFHDEMVDTLFGDHAVPSTNGSLRREFSRMTREVLDGRDPYGGNGGGLLGWAYHFRTRFNLSEERAHELAKRLERTMADRDG